MTDNYCPQDQRDIDAREALSKVRSGAFEDCIFAIRGAIAFGLRGTKAPPDGHWLEEFYDIGKKLARPAPEALPNLCGMAVVAEPSLAPGEFEIRNASPEALGAAKGELSDEQIMQAMESAGVEFQNVYHPRLKSNKVTTCGSIDAIKIIAGARAILAKANGV